MIRLFLATVLLMASQAVFASECVVLLHGLGRTPYSMWFLESRLETAGYVVWNEGYSSTEKTIEQLVPVVGEAIADCKEKNASPIHFVTHSMGGILVRAYFQGRPLPQAGRVVMLAPPNHGSEVVDAYKDRWWFRKSTGPAGQQLGTGVESVPNKLAPVNLEIGVIAGTGNAEPWFSGLFPGDHDGKVSVQSAALAEMKDLLVVHSGHTFMMNSPRVIKQVQTFLRTGAFEKPLSSE